jgi:hypothetical protein
MFRSLVVVFFCTFSISVSAQLALSESSAISQGIVVETLDSLYMNGVHTNPDSAVFADKQTQYIKAYYGLLQDINTYLNSNSFRWGGMTRCFNRIYFNEDGSIQYFIYSFEDGEISTEREEEFDQLLNEFIADYRFPLANNKKFSQCSPANYRDVL